MHGPRWGSPDEELIREHRSLFECAFRLGHENHVLRWLLAEARAVTALGRGALVGPRAGQNLTGAPCTDS